MMAKKIDYFSDESIRSDLKRKTVRGGMFTAAAQAAQVGIQLAALPILARLLDPADFGLVAMVTVFTHFAVMFVDVGLSMATVQRPKITQYQVSNLFWLSLALGSAISFLVAALSPLIAWIYGEPRLIAITLALCPSFVFAGLTLQPQALLRRAMRFKVIATVQVLSVLMGYTAAIAWAWCYRDYWAMVVFPVVTAFVRMSGTWVACGWRPSRPRRNTGVWQMIAFGGHLTGFNLTNYFSRNADNMLIGWYWGAMPLGLYAQAYKLLLFPLQQIMGPLTGVTVGALSRSVDDPPRYRRAYGKILESLLLVTVPLMVFVLATRDLCIEVLLGSQWMEAVPIFAWLGVAALVQPFTASLGWLLISQGRAKEMFGWSIFASIVSVASFLVGLPWGPVYVAACYVVANIAIHMPTLVYLATREGPVRLRDLLFSVRVPALVATAVLAETVLIRGFVATGNSYADLAIYSIAAAVVWVGVMLLTSAGRHRLVYYSRSLVGK